MVLTSMVQSASSYSGLLGVSTWPWIKIGIFLLSWWSNVPSCKILELSGQFVSCLQRILSHFPTMWQYHLELCPPTLKNTRHLPLIMLINCTKLYDPALMVQSVSCLQCILPRFPTMWQYNLYLGPLILKNNRYFPLNMVINCIS